MKKVTTFVIVLIAALAAIGQRSNVGYAGEGDNPFWLQEFNNVFELPAGWQNTDYSGSDIVWEFGGMHAITYNYWESEEEPRVHNALVTHPVDCSNHSNVMLGVNHRMLFFEDYDSYRVSIQVSVDAEVWNEVADYTGFIEYEDDFSGNLPYHEYDISEFADGQDEVFVRFEFEGNQDLDVEWQIQELSFFSAPEVELPSPAALINPANGINISPVVQYLEWNPGEGAEPDGYKVYFDQVNPPQELVYQGDNLFYMADNLEYDKEYFWKVVPYNENGDAQDVPVWSFTTYDLVTLWEDDFQVMDGEADWDVVNHSGSETEWVFNGVRAQIGTPLESDDLTPVWSTMTSPVVDCSGYENIRLFINQDLWHDLEYENYYARIEISTDEESWEEVALYQGSLFEDKKWGWGLPYYEFDVSQLVDDQPQVWIRLEFNSNGDWDVTWDVDKIGFKATPIELGPVSLISPVNNAVNQPVDVALEWQQGSGPEPDGYRVYMDQVNPPETLVYDGSDTQYPLHELDWETTYFWKVVPYIGDEEAGEASIWSFTTMDEFAGISQVPHYEDFNHVETPNLPLGWTDYVNSTSNFAEVRTFTMEEDPFDCEPFNGPNHLRLNNSGHHEAELFFISPPVYPDISTLRVRFYAMTVDAQHIGSENNVIEVGVMSDPDDPDTFIPQGSVVIGLEYNHFMVSLENHSDNGNLIAFRALMAESNQFVYLDNIVIEEIPNDPQLTVLPDSLQFGYLEHNYQQITREVTVSNWGGGSIIVNPEDIYLEGQDTEDFSLENIEHAMTLEAFDDFEVSITFAPLSSGEKSVVLHVGDQQIPVEGYSVNPNIVGLPYFENFDNVREPELPIGWRSVVESTDPDVDVVTIEATANQPSEPNVLRFVSRSDENARIYFISPLVDLEDNTDYLWVRFWARPSLRHDYMQVGTLSDREDVSTFEKVEKVKLYPEAGQFWEYAVRVPVTEEPFYIALKPDFYGKQRNILVDDITIEGAPDLTSVEILVKEDSPEGATLEDAELNVLGHSPIVSRIVNTDENGLATLELEAGVYSVFSNYPGYQEKEQVFEVVDQPATLEVGMTHVVYPPFNLKVTAQEMESGSALLEWNDPGDVHEFRYDNGQVYSSLGFGGDYQQELKTLGSAYHYL